MNFGREKGNAKDKVTNGVYNPAVLNNKDAGVIRYFIGNSWDTEAPLRAVDPSVALTRPIPEVASAATWATASAVPLLSSPSKVAYGNGTIVVVGNAVNGAATWTTGPGTYPNFLAVPPNSVTYAFGRFYSGATNSQSNHRTSMGGLSWATSSSNGSGVAWASSSTALMSAGNGNALQITTDGVTWSTTGLTPRAMTALLGLAYGNNTWVVTGYLSSGLIGGGTTAATSGGIGTPGYGLAYGSGTFVGGNSAGIIKVSTDNGVTWNTQTTLFGGASVNTIGFANNNFIAGGAQSPWVTQTSTFTTNIYSVAYGNGTWVAVSNGVVPSWTTQTSQFGTTNICSIAYGNGVWVAGGDAGLIRTSTDAVNWVTQTSTFTTSVNGVAFGGGTFVAVGNGQVRTSTDNGVTWNTQSANGANITYSVSYGNGTFVLVGNAGVGLQTSTNNGVTWTTQFNPGVNLRAIGYANGTWVAGAGATGIFTSPDAVTWTTRGVSTGQGANWQKVAYGNGTWVIVSNITFSRTSTDNGVTWTNAYGLSNAIGITYANGVFIAGTTTGVIKSSYDGVSWVTQTANFGTSSINAIAYNNGTFVAVGAGGALRTSTNAGTEPLVTSTDTVTWKSAAFNKGEFGLCAVSYGNGTWVAAGANGAVKTSTDAVTWTTRTTPYSDTAAPTKPSVAALAYGNGIWLANITTPITLGTTWNTVTNANFTTTFQAVVYGNGTWMAAGNAGVVYYSPDLITWYPNTILIGTSSIATLAYGNGIWVAGISSGGALRTTTSEGGVWQVQASNFGTSAIQSVAYGNGTFVAVGAGGTLRTSTNAINWNTQTSQFGTSNICAVAYGNGVWIAVGVAGTLRTSTDTVNWNTQTSNFGSSVIYSAAYANGTWVAVGFGGAIRTSTDTVNWNTQTSNFSTAILSVTYGNGTFVAAGFNGTLQTSTNNGITWNTQTSAFGTYNINAVAYGNGVFMAVGAGGVVRYSVGQTSLISSTDNAVTWNTVTTFPVATTAVYSLAYGNGTFLVGGANSLLQASTNLTSWTSRNSLTPSYAISTLAYGNGIWILGTIGGGSRTSTDNGVTWNTSSPLVSANYGTAYGNNVFVVSLGTYAKASVDGINWVTTPTITASSGINAITYGNGTWVAGGVGGILKTNAFAETLSWSSNFGTSWTSASTPVSYGLTAINAAAYGNGTWVVGGANGFLKTTTDISSLSTWVTRTANLAAGVTVAALAYGNGVFMLGGSSNVMRTSTDNGVTWNSQAIAILGGAPSSIAYGNGTWVVGNGSTSYLKTSTDNGVTWTTQASKLAGVASVTFLDKYGMFVAGGTLLSASAPMSYSTDAVTWTTVYSTNGVITSMAQNANRIINYDSNGNLYYTDLIVPNAFYSTNNGTTWTTSNFYGLTLNRALAYGNGTFVAADMTGIVKTSSDGINWTSQANFGVSAWSATYGNGTFVVAGNSSLLRTSTDNGVTWSTPTSLAAATFYNVSYGNGIFTASGSNQTLLTSVDAVTWTSQAAPTLSGQPINAMTYGNNTWVAVGGFTNAAAIGEHSVAEPIMISRDMGQSWTTVTYNSGTYHLTAIAYGNKIFVAGGSNGSIKTSTNATTWVTQTSNFARVPVYSIAYGNNTFVAGAYDGSVRTSTNNGITWNTQTSNFTTSICAVSYGNGIWVAGGAVGTLRTSTDNGITWNTQTSNLANNIQAIAYGNNVWVIGGVTGGLRTSTDSGVTWTTQASYSAAVNSLSYDGTKFVLGGGSGIIMTSLDAVTWTTDSSNLASSSPVQAILSSDGVSIALTTDKNLRIKTNSLSSLALNPTSTVSGYTNE